MAKPRKRDLGEGLEDWEEVDWEEMWGEFPPRRSLRTRLGDFFGRIPFRTGVIALLVVALLGTAGFFGRPKPDYIAKATAATFELEIMTAVQIWAKEGWKDFWPLFAEANGATLFAEEGRLVVFYVPAGGGTAFFFARDQINDRGESYLYALTNAHVADMRTDVKKLPHIDKISESVLRTALWYCPNFTHFESSPTCATGASLQLRFTDPVLDYAVLRFEWIKKEVAERVVTLELGDERTLKPGAPLVIVGAPMGVEDIRQDARLLHAAVPYFSHPTWRWVIPYDQNSAGGFSGSPVIDPKTGRVIGLHRGAIRDSRGSGRSIGLIIPMSLIRLSLALNGYPIKNIDL